MESLILQWGLLALFVGVAVEGDVTMLIGGGVAHLGFYALVTVLAVGAAAAVASDTLLFLAGRRAARHPGLTRLSARMPERAGGVARFVERVGPSQLLYVRFLWGMRIPSLLFLGSGSVSLPRFFVFSITGSLIWSTLIGGAGYLFSTTAAALLGEVRRLESWFLLALLVGGGIVFLLHRLERRGAERAKRIIEPARQVPMPGEGS